MSKQKNGKLYLIPTPLAKNSLEYIVTPKLVKVIRDLDHFLVENIRTARRFISSLDLGKTIETIHFNLLDKNTSAEHIGRLCAPILDGIDIGVLSEAGCPGVADPGNLAVSFAHQQNVEVIPLVGPSSIFMALMASGFNGQSFVFHGYLPIDRQHRVLAIKTIEKEARNKRQTQIFMETPYRNNQLFSDVLKHCRPDTQLCVATDITGQTQRIHSLSVRDWKRSIPDMHKVPTVFLMYC